MDSHEQTHGLAQAQLHSDYTQATRESGNLGPPPDLSQQHSNLAHQVPSQTPVQQPLQQQVTLPLRPQNHFQQYSHHPAEFAAQVISNPQNIQTGAIPYNAYRPHNQGIMSGLRANPNGFYPNNPPSDMYYSVPVSTPLYTNPPTGVYQQQGVGDALQIPIHHNTPSIKQEIGFLPPQTGDVLQMPIHHNVPPMKQEIGFIPPQTGGSMIGFGGRTVSYQVEPAVANHNGQQLPHPSSFQRPLNWTDPSSQFQVSPEYNMNSVAITAQPPAVAQTYGATGFDLSSFLKNATYGHVHSTTSLLQPQYGYGPPSPAIGAPLHANFLQQITPMVQANGASMYPQNLNWNQPLFPGYIPTPQHLPDQWANPLFPTPQGIATIPGRPADHISISNRHNHIPSGDKHDFTGHPVSCEALLTRASRAYITMLHYNSNARRMSMSRAGGSSNNNLRYHIHPKPPRQLPVRSNFNLNPAVVAAIQSQPPVITTPVTMMPVLPPVMSSDGSFSSISPHTVSVVPGSAVPASVHATQQSVMHEIKGLITTFTKACEASNWQWIEGIIMGGCLMFALSRHADSADWFRRAMAVDKNRIESISNLAVVLYVMGQPNEAESLWLQALHIAPEYLDSTEHLFGLIYSRNPEKVIEVINFAQTKLRVTQSTVMSDSDRAIGVGSSGYLIPGCDNGRMVGLIHAKGSMLYSLKNVRGALSSFEEAVLISTGRTGAMIHDLVRDVRHVLSPLSLYGNRNDVGGAVPLLLRPETAKTTVQLVFPPAGVLPGLNLVPDGSPRRMAMQITSSSLLSLAKILQDSLSSGTVFSDQPTSVGDILALYYLSLSLQESPSTANNVGILLATVQQPACAPMNPHQIPPVNVAGIVPGSGLSFALAYYDYGLKLDPKHVHLHTNLGSLLKDVGQLDLAISVYERAVQCDAKFDIALTNLANAVKDRGRISDAIKYYRQAVIVNPKFAEAVCGLFTALGSVCDWVGRGGAFLRGGILDQWHVDDEGKLQNVHNIRNHSGLTDKVMDIVHKQLSDASNWGSGLFTEELIVSYARQISVMLDQPETSLIVAAKMREMAGKPFEGSQLVRLIERVSRVTMWQWYHDRLNNRQRDVSVYSRLPVPSALTVPVTPTVLPFHTFTCPLDANEVRMISQRNAMRISCLTLRSNWLPASVYSPPNPPNPVLVVGYVSSDFNNHPLAHLMQSVFGFHDRQRVLAICYATTASDGSIHRKQIEREAPIFRDVSSWTSEKIVQQIVTDGCHILVNLNGYTRGARNEIFAARPAPIHMSFMGFAGTMGAEWCDYLLADESAVPRETLRPCRNNMDVMSVFGDDNESTSGDWIYSENLVYCRDTFFCCDHAQSSDAGEPLVTWEQEQERRWAMRRRLFPTLPDECIIMGNFNQLYKIDPTTFRTWLRILTQCPNSILWLLRFPELGEKNLLATAKRWAGAEVASRIKFTDVAQKQDHISRARVCDIFLDTAECNAHTTAADILWSSTPLLTLPRYPYKMCSRMASSILRGALPKTPEGLAAASNLIASSEDDYENMAVSLVQSLRNVPTDRGYCVGVGRLADIRKLLFENRWTCGLFDTRRWVRDLEDAYTLAWEKWVKGESGDIDL